MKSDREPWADLCRSMSIFGVIIIHSSGEKFYRYGELGRSDWLVVNLLDSAVRCAVPLFVMLSGYLLLNAGDNDIRSIPKRIVKVLIPLLCWSAVYLYFLKIVTGGKFDIFILWNRPAMYHLWFVYMIIGLYIIYPFYFAIHSYAKNDTKIKIYMVVIWILFSSLAVFWKVPPLSLIQQDNFLGYGGYFLLGSFLVPSFAQVLSWPVVIAAYGVGVAATFGATWYLSARAGVASEVAYSYFAPNVLISSIGAFLIFHKIRVSKFAAVISRNVSDLSFMIFFMHILILEYVKVYVGPKLSGLNVALEILVISICTFMICLLLATIIRLFPHSRKILG